MCSSIMSTYWFWHLLFSYENVNKEKQRNNILLAHRKNPKYSLVKLLKLQNDAKSTIIDVTKVFGENLSTVSKTGLRRIESRRPWKRRKEWPALSSGAQISRFETLQASWKGRLQRCTELKKTSRNFDLQSRKLCMKILMKFDCVLQNDEIYVKADFK